MTFSLMICWPVPLWEEVLRAFVSGKNDVISKKKENFLVVSQFSINFAGMKRIYRIFVLASLAFFPLFAQGQEMQWNARFQTYIDQYRDLAIEQMLKYKIPASITLAQGLFESGAGKSQLATRGNNHFGIKCHGWQGRTV